MHRTHPFLQLLQLVGLSLAATLVLAIIEFILSSYIPQSQTFLPSEVHTLLQLFGSQLLGFALPLFILGWLHYRGRQRDTFRFHFAGHYWLLGLYCVVVLLLLMPITDWLSVWNHRLHLPASLAGLEELMRSLGEQSQSMLLPLIGNTPLTLSLLCIALAPAICEELFFRAGVQNLLQKCIPSKHAVVWLTAAIFSLAHFELFDFLPRLLLGVLMGYAYLYGGSIVINATIHFFNNAIIVMAYHLYLNGHLFFDPASPLELNWILTLCCSLAAAGLFYILFLLPKSSPNNKRLSIQ